MEELTYKIVSAIYRSNEFHNVFADTDNYNKLQDIVEKSIKDYEKEKRIKNGFKTFINNNF